MSDLEQRVDKLRNILLSDAFDRKKKVRVLKRVLELRDEPQVCALIREATKLPVNQPILADFVRVLGYLGDPGVLEDLAGYLDHPRKLVARNAVKAAVSFDPERAVEMVMRVVRTAPLKNVSAAVKVLAERCPREAGPAVEKLMASRSRRDRLVAVMFLTHATDLEAAGRLLDLLQTEREPAIVDLAFRALDCQASEAHRSCIEELRTQLWAKTERLRDLLTRLPGEPLRAQAALTPSRKYMVLRPPEVVAPPPSAPILLPREDSRPELLRHERVPAPEAAAEPPDSRPQKLLPWQEKEQKLKEKRATEAVAASTPSAPRGQALKPLGAALLVAGTAAALLFGIANRAPPVAPPKRVVDIARSPLGGVNAKVTFVGTIVEVHADYNTMLVRAKDGTLASVRFADSIATFAAGRAVEIAGTIREIRGGGICVLDGSTARLP